MAPCKGQAPLDGLIGVNIGDEKKVMSGGEGFPLIDC